MAMITPFDNTGAIDREATTKLVEYLLKNGTDFLVVLGTTGEAPTLSPQEQKAYVNHVIELTGGRVPIVVGKSGNDTQRLVEELQTMNYDGVDYILSAVPNYNKPSQHGIFEHYKAVAAASKRPVILYNVPGRTGVNMTAETTCRIAREIPNVAAVKEASGNLDQVAKIIRERPEEFLVLSGDDSMTLPLIALGGEGVISVIGNATPRHFSQLVHATLQNDTKSAAPIHADLLPLFGQLFAQGNPAGIKCAMSHLKICENVLRLPLVSVDKELAAQIKQSLDTLFSK